MQGRRERRKEQAEEREKASRFIRQNANWNVLVSQPAIWPSAAGAAFPIRVNRCKLNDRAPIVAPFTHTLKSGNFPINSLQIEIKAGQWARDNFAKSFRDGDKYPEQLVATFSIGEELRRQSRLKVDPNFGYFTGNCNHYWMFLFIKDKHSVRNFF